MQKSLEKKLFLGGFVDFSTVDIPGRSSAVIFLSGCNFDCSFCQNSHILSLSSGKLVSLEKIVSMIEKKMPSLPTTTAIVSGMQVQEFIKIAHKINGGNAGEPIAGRLWMYSGLTGRVEIVEVGKRIDCNVCRFYE